MHNENMIKIKIGEHYPTVRTNLNVQRQKMSQYKRESKGGKRSNKCAMITGTTHHFLRVRFINNKVHNGNTQKC